MDISEIEAFLAENPKRLVGGLPSWQDVERPGELAATEKARPSTELALGNGIVVGISEALTRRKASLIRLAAMLYGIAGVEIGTGALNNSCSCAVWRSLGHPSSPLGNWLGTDGSCEPGEN